MVPSVNEIEMADMEQCCAWIAHGQLPVTQHATDRFKMVIERACQIIENELETIKANNQLPSDGRIKFLTEQFFGAMVTFKGRVAVLAMLDHDLIAARDRVYSKTDDVIDYLNTHSKSNVVMFRKV